MSTSPLEHSSLPPNTTLQQDLVVAGQRRVNLIWEVTQAIIAVGVVGALIYSALNGSTPVDLGNAAFLIVGFYFSRTNHQNTGGIGYKSSESQEYRGR